MQLSECNRGRVVCMLGPQGHLLYGHITGLVVDAANPNRVCATVQWATPVDLSRLGTIAAIPPGEEVVDPANLSVLG
jgi:hypothetical protein